MGSGAAAMSAYRTLIHQKEDENEIIIVSPEERLFYSRVLLPNYIAGKIERDDLFFKGIDINRKDVKVIYHKVERIFDREGYLELDNKEKVYYDKLIISTGSKAKNIECKNNHLEGVYNLRSIIDADQIRDRAFQSDECIVVGGGLVSLKAAWCLEALGKKVTILVNSNKVLSAIGDNTVSDIVIDKFNKAGVLILKNTGVSEFIGESSLEGALLDNGAKIKCNLAVVGKGVTPNIDFVQGTDIKKDEGILSDIYLKSSVDNIYVAGDVAESQNMYNDEETLITLWPDAVNQGRIAALNIMGNKVQYTGNIPVNSVTFFGTSIITLGDVKDKEREGYTSFTEYKRDHDNPVFRKIVMKDGCIVGAVLVGEINYSGMIYWDIRRKLKVNNPQEYLTLRGLEEIYIHRNTNCENF